MAMARKKTKTEFEYASNWRSTCRKVHWLMPFCTCNPMHGRGVYIHHTKYRRGPLRRILGLLLFHAPKKSVSGVEIVGYDVFPLCEACHRNAYGRSTDPNSVHYTGEDNPKWIQLGGLDSHNTDCFAWRLRLKFWFWVTVLRLGRVLLRLFRKPKKRTY